MANTKKLLQAAAGAAGGNVGAWDIDYLYKDDPITFNIATAIYDGNFSVAGVDTAPQGIVFKEGDPKRFYISGVGSGEIHEYQISSSATVADYDVQQASLVTDVNPSTPAGVIINPQEIRWKPDGTRLYIMNNGDDRVYEFSLSTAWDLSTLTKVNDFYVGTQENSPNGLFFKPDGTKMYVCGQGFDVVAEYDLSTAWDTSTASINQTLSVNSQESIPESVIFKPDGTEMYLTGSSGDEINYYTLSTAWDISTATHQGFLSISGYESIPTGLDMDPNGWYMFVIGQSGDDINRFVTHGLTVTGTGTAGQDNVYNCHFDSSGERLYIVGPSTSKVSQYSLSTAFDTSTATFVRNQAITEDNTPQDVFFKPDGTKMYVLCASGDEINYYTLSTAWDISTETHDGVFSIASEDTGPQGFWFKPDGTKFYMVGRAFDYVYQYSMSTAWDMSTASYDSKSVDVNPPSSNPRSIALDPDGLKMLMSDNDGFVYEFNLSTAWDISTAVRDTSKRFVSGVKGCYGLHVNEDGDKLFLVSNSADKVFTFTFGEQE